MDRLVAGGRPAVERFQASAPGRPKITFGIVGLCPSGPPRGTRALTCVGIAGSVVIVGAVFARRSSCAGPDGGEVFQNLTHEVTACLSSSTTGTVTGRDGGIMEQPGKAVETGSFRDWWTYVDRARRRQGELMDQPGPGPADHAIADSRYLGNRNAAGVSGTGATPHATTGAADCPGADQDGLHMGPCARSQRRTAMPGGGPSDLPDRLGAAPTAR